MKFLNPLMLYLVFTLPVIVLFYMLRMRRKDTMISSTYLWQDILKDVQASTPWQRLRFSILMLLQLIILFLLILALASPAISKRVDKAENIVLVIDISQSMGSKENGENGGSRLDMAKAKAKKIVSQAPTETRISLITAADNARIITINSHDKSVIQDEIDNLKPEGSSTNVDNAIHLGTSIVNQFNSSEIYLFSDGCFEEIETAGMKIPVSFVRIGQSDTNIAIRTASIVENPSPPHNPELFVSVKNFSSTEHDVIVSVYSKSTFTKNSVSNDHGGSSSKLPSGNTFIDSKQLSLEPWATQSAIFSNGIDGIEAAEIKISCINGNDALSIDDKAEVVTANDSLGDITLVTAGNTFLEKGLRSVSSAKITVVSPNVWRQNQEHVREKANGNVKEAAKNDIKGAPSGKNIIVFDGIIPDVMPGSNVMIINPPLSKGNVTPGLFEALSKKKTASIESLDPNHPVLRFCDLSEVKVSSIKAVLMPEWMRIIAAGKFANGSIDTKAAVIAAGEKDGTRLVIICFDLLDSDLPLRVTFPILLANIVDYLSPASVNGNKNAGLGLVAADKATDSTQKGKTNNSNNANESDITPAGHLELKYIATRKTGRDTVTVDDELQSWIAATALLLLLAESWVYVKGY